MRLYIIAGEASGDLHAANLMKEIRRLNSNCLFRGIGGDLMEQEGMVLLKHFRETAYMGFLEVVRNLKKIMGFIELTKKDIRQWKPDAIILVDYPGFNLRIADFARQNHFRVFYYISPQVWAWKASRVKKIKRTVDQLFVILPFEKEFYGKWGMDVTFVGHPLLDATAQFIHQDTIRTGGRTTVALLPGSRKQEISKMLPVMLALIPEFEEVDFVVAGVSSVEVSFYHDIIGSSRASLIMNKTYQLLSYADAALVTSGTATLEAALFNVPEVVCYKGSAVSFWIGKQLVDVKYISLVNLILDRPLVQELIQQEFTVANLKTALTQLISDENKISTIKKGYAELKAKLGGSGASAKTAHHIIEALT